MVDKYTKVVLTIIALNLTIMTGKELLAGMFPKAFAEWEQQFVYIVGGELDYSTKGSTLKVHCTNCD